MAPPAPADRILAESRYLRFIDRNGWFFVERPGLRGVVTIVAVTDTGNILFVEQFRAPLGRPVIELPAGLAGDDPEHAGEELAAAAQRELQEETGYAAAELRHLADCPTSAGMTNEVVSFFRASGLRRVGPGGGVPGEGITVHEVPLGDAPRWLAARAAAGTPIAAKVYAGLFFAAGPV